MAAETANLHAARFGWSVAAITVGAVVLSAVAGPSLAGRPGVAFAWLLFVGSSVHVAATLALFSFHEVRDYAGRHRVRYVAVPLGLLATTAAAWPLEPAQIRPLILLGFFGWQLWHYQKQNLGLASLAMRATRVPRLSAAERRCVLGSGMAGLLVLVAHPGVLQLVTWRPPALLARGTFAVAGTLLVGCFAAAMRCLLGRWRLDAAARASATVFIVAVAFPLPLFVAHSPYAAIGGLTLAHGLQYLLLVGRVVAGPAWGRRRGYDPSRYLAIAAIVVAAAFGLAAASHLHRSAEPVGRILFGGYLALVMTHFVVDAGLWRLRDVFPRRWLRQRLPELLGSPG